MQTIKVIHFPENTYNLTKKQKIEEKLLQVPTNSKDIAF